MKPALIILAFAATAAPALGQGFTCRIGQDAACLDWGESVCSSGGMCVDANAACFEPYQCDYKGLTCKSNVDDCVETHDKLVRDFNSLAGDYETLRLAGVDLSDTFDSLQTDFETLQRQAQQLKDSQAATQTCLIYARTLEDAQLCAP